MTEKRPGPAPGVQFIEVSVLYSEVSDKRELTVFHFFAKGEAQIQIFKLISITSNYLRAIFLTLVLFSSVSTDLLFPLFICYRPSRPRLTQRWRME